MEESLQLLLTNDATKTRQLSRNRIYSNCQRLLWEFFWAAFEFLNAVHFNNSIIKTDTGPGRARWSSGDVAQIYFCSFIAALLDFREGDRARGNYRRRRTKRSGDTLWRCDIKNNCWQTGKTTRPSFTSMFLLEIYFLAARVKLLFIKIHVLQLIMFIKCPHKKCFKMHQRIQAWVGLHKDPNAGLQAGKVMKSKRCIGSVGKSN